MSLVWLYHLSSHPELAAPRVGDEFVLRPGPQGAEGSGVYFSAGTHVPTSTAEGSRGKPVAMVEIVAESPAGWWRTKPGLAKKFHRPITWHSAGKSLRCRVDRVGAGLLDGVSIPVATCSWRFA